MRSHSLPKETNDIWQSTWRQFAPGKNQLHFFEAGVASRIEYQDIQRSSDLSCLCGVVEHNQRPLIYIAQDDSLNGEQPTEISNICRLLACRGEKAFLAHISRGTLTLFPCLLEGGGEVEQKRDIKFSDAASVIRGLSEGIIPPQLVHPDKKLREVNLRKKMLEAFISAAKSLRKVPGLELTKNNPNEDHRRLSTILSLLGRVLFMCFLCDRELTPKEIAPIRRNQYDRFSLFTSPANAAEICLWQDNTFNGDFLPLLPFHKSVELPSLSDYVKFFEKYNVLNEIQCFSNGDFGNQLNLIRLLDFRHVPVGLLSEVYEAFAHQFFEHEANSTSIHYTPRHVAEVLINQTFRGVPSQDRSTMRILDPSAGAGVFLVLSLRKLVQEAIHEGREISAPYIRHILYKQIMGMDINIHALRLSTLALYLAAIDLDPNPAPVTKQHFDKPLLGTVLHHVEDTSKLGALGDLGAPSALGGQFDIVIGNPPWTKISNSTQQDLMRNATKETALRVRKDIADDIKSFGGSFDALSPNFNPAFPFLWRCVEWTTPNGIIALVLPAEQILFREHISRNILFRNIKVTAIVNGADLHKTSFWEDMCEPFCLLFARNAIPQNTDTFLYLNVYVENLTKDQHRLRLDSSQCRDISFEWIENNPHLLKTLFRGSELDLSIIEKMKQSNHVTTLRDFIKSLTPGATIGKGYAVKSISEKLPEDKKVKLEERRKENYKKLLGINPLNIPTGKYKNKSVPLLNETEIPAFHINNEQIESARDLNLYAPPLVIIPEAADQGPILYTGKRNIAFSQSFTGISLSGIADAELIATYLSILFHSDIPTYFALLTGARYGCNWSTVLLKEIETLPIIPWNNLEDRDKDFCREVLESWKNGEDRKQDIFSRICEIYNINKYEQIVIKDTLQTKAPSQRKNAQRKPTKKEITEFTKYINLDVNTLTQIYNSTDKFFVETHETEIEGWIFIRIHQNKHNSNTDKLDTARALNICKEIADNEGCSNVIIPDHANKSILLGLLSQYRYWTNSQARLYSQKVKYLIDKNRCSWGLE